VGTPGETYGIQYTPYSKAQAALRAVADPDIAGCFLFRVRSSAAGAVVRQQGAWGAPQGKGRPIGLQGVQGGCGGGAPGGPGHPGGTCLQRLCPGPPAVSCPCGWARGMGWPGQAECAGAATGWVLLTQGCLPQRPGVPPVAATCMG
jgi:hypothetical protein